MNPMSSEELRHRPAAMRKGQEEKPQRREDAKVPVGWTSGCSAAAGYSGKANPCDEPHAKRGCGTRPAEINRWAPVTSLPRTSCDENTGTASGCQSLNGIDSQCPTSRLRPQDRERLPDMGIGTGSSRNLIRREHDHGRPMNRRPDRPQHRRRQTGSSWRDALSIPDTPPRHDRQPACRHRDRHLRSGDATSSTEGRSGRARA